MCADVTPTIIAGQNINDIAIGDTYNIVTDKGVFSGNSLEELTNIFPYYEVNGIQFDSNDEKLYSFGAFMGNTPFVSYTNDGGETWCTSQLWTQVMGDSYVYSLALDPNDQNVGYCGMYGLICKTTDGGNSWDSSLFKNVIESSELGARLSRTLYTSVIIDPLHPSRIFAAGRNNSYNLTVYESQNSGESWCVYAEIPSAKTATVMDMAVNDGVLFVYCASGELYQVLDNQSIGGFQPVSCSQSDSTEKYFTIDGRKASPSQKGLLISDKKGLTIIK